MGLLFLGACKKPAHSTELVRQALKAPPFLLDAHQLIQNEYETRYWTKKSLPIVKQFYMHEMERMGWQLYAQHHALHETLLVFDKPRALAIVHITYRTNNSWYVRIITMQHKAIAQEN